MPVFDFLLGTFSYIYYFHFKMQCHACHGVICIDRDLIARNCCHPHLLFGSILAVGKKSHACFDRLHTLKQVLADLFDEIRANLPVGLLRGDNGTEAGTRGFAMQLAL